MQFFDLKNNPDLSSQLDDEHKFGHTPDENPDEKFEALVADLSDDELRALRNFIDAKFETEENPAEMDDDDDEEPEETESFADMSKFENSEEEV